MYNDITVRTIILKSFPGIEPWRMEMEDLDYGDRMGVFFRKPDGTIQRVNVVVKGKTEEQIAADFVEKLKEPVPLVYEQPRAFISTEPQTVLMSEVNSIKTFSPYEGKRGKHPKDCTCSKHGGMNGSQQATQ